MLIVRYRKERLLNRLVHTLHLYAEYLTNNAKEVFLDWSMVDASLILKGIGVKWAREPEYKKVLSLDARTVLIWGFDPIDTTSRIIFFITKPQQFHMF